MPDHHAEVPTLYLLRHAKSSWDDPSLDDHDRPLSPRGRNAVKRVRRHLEEAEILPQLVLCSPATRTRETLAGIEPALGDETEITFDGALYGASAELLLRRLGRVPDEVESVLVIGHNPGLEDLATMLAGGGERLPELQQKFPTGALATLAVPGGWRELRPGAAELVGYVVPREL